MDQEYEAATDRISARFKTLTIIHSGCHGTGDGTESASTSANRNKMASRFVGVAWTVRAVAPLALRLQGGS
jgi:hypothetical protein